MSSYNQYSAYQVLTTQETTQQQTLNAENLFITKLLKTDISGVNLAFTSSDVSANSGIYYGDVTNANDNAISTSLDINTKIAENAFAIFSSYTAVAKTGVDEDVSLNLGTNRWASAPNTITKNVGLDTSCNPFITGVLHVDTSANYGPYNSIDNSNNTPWTALFNSSNNNALLSVALNTQYNNSTGNSLTTVIEDLSFNTQYALGGMGAANPTTLDKYFSVGLNDSPVVNDLCSNYTLSNLQGFVTVPNNVSDSLYGMYKFDTIEPGIYVTLFQTDASGNITVDHTNDPAFPSLDGQGHPLYDSSMSFATFQSLVGNSHQTSQGWYFDMNIAVGGGYTIANSVDEPYFTVDSSGVVNNHIYMMNDYQNQSNILSVMNGNVTLDASSNANPDNLTSNIILDISGGEQLSAADAVQNGEVILFTRNPNSRANIITQTGLAGALPYVFYSATDSSYATIGATTVLHTTYRTTEYVNYDFSYFHNSTGNEDLTATATSNGASLYTNDQIASFYSDISGTICPSVYDAIHIHIGPTNNITQNGKMYELTDACYNAVDYYYTYNGDTSNYNYSYDNYFTPVNAIVNVDITGLQLEQVLLENYRVLLHQKHIVDLCMNISDPDWSVGYYGADTYLKSSASALAESIAPSTSECASIIANNTTTTINVTYKYTQTTTNPSYLFDYVTISWGTSGETIVLDESKIDFSNNSTTNSYTIIPSNQVVSDSGSFIPSNYKFVQTVVTELYNSSFILPYAAWNNLVMTTPELQSTITYYEAYPIWATVTIDGSGNLVTSEGPVNPAILTHFTYVPVLGEEYPMSNSVEVIVDASSGLQASTTFVASKQGVTALRAVLQFADMSGNPPAWSEVGAEFDVDTYFGETVSFTIPNLTPPDATGEITINPEFISNINLMNLNVEYYVIPMKQNVKPVFTDVTATGYVTNVQYSPTPGQNFAVTLNSNYIYNDDGFLAAIDIKIYYNATGDFIARVVTAGPFISSDLDIWYADTGLGVVIRTLDSSVISYLVPTPQLTEIDEGVYLYQVNNLAAGDNINFDLLPDQIAVSLVGPVTTDLSNITASDIANGFTYPGAAPIYISQYRGYDIGTPNPNDNQYYVITRTPGSMQYIINYSPTLASQSAVTLSTDPYNINNIVDASSNVIGNLGLVLGSNYSFLPPSSFPPSGTYNVFLNVTGAAVNITWGNPDEPTDWSGNIVTTLKTYLLFNEFQNYQITSARVTSSIIFNYRIDYSFLQMLIYHYNSYIGNPLLISDHSWNLVAAQQHGVYELGGPGIYFNDVYDASNNSTDINGNERLLFQTTQTIGLIRDAYFVFARPYLKFTELGYNGAQNVLFNIPSAQYDSSKLLSKYMPVTTQVSGTTYNPFAVDASSNNITFTQGYDMCYNNYAFGAHVDTNYFDIVGSNIKITQIHNNGGSQVTQIMYNGPIANLNNYSDEALDVSGNRNAATNAYKILFPQDTAPILDESIGGVDTSYNTIQNIIVNIGNSVLPDASFNLVLRPLEGTTVELYYWKNVKITDPTYFVDVSGASCYELTRLTTDVVNYALIPTGIPLQRVKLTPTSGEFALVAYPSVSNILAVEPGNLNLSLYQKTLIATPTVNINTLNWRDLSGTFIDASNNYFAYVTLTPMTALQVVGENDIAEILITSDEIPLKMTSIYNAPVVSARNGFGYHTGGVTPMGYTTAQAYSGHYVKLVNGAYYQLGNASIGDIYAPFDLSTAGETFPNFPHQPLL